MFRERSNGTIFRAFAVQTFWQTAELAVVFVASAAIAALAAGFLWFLEVLGTNTAAKVGSVTTTDLVRFLVLVGDVTLFSFGMARIVVDFFQLVWGGAGQNEH